MSLPENRPESAAGDRRQAGSGHGRIAVFPGSFDPFTNGHVDVVARSARLFDRVVVGVLVNERKTPLFDAAERVALIREVFRDEPAIEVDTFDGLLVEFAARRGAQTIVRGVRGVADFDYEFQMALMNRRLAESIETIFMMPSAEYSYVSSRLVKEVFMFGGAVSGLVPPVVERALRARRPSST